MVAALVDGREGAGVVGDHVVLELAHRLELQARLLAEGGASLVEGVLGGAFEGVAVLVEERAEHAEGGKRGERVHEGRGEARHDIEVAAAGLDVREEAGAVDALAARKDLVKVVGVVDDEVEGLQAPIAARVHEVDVADRIVADEGLDVLLRELAAGLLQLFHEAVA